MTAPQPSTTPTLLTTPQAAAWLNLKPQTLRKWRWQGTGPRFVRLGISPQSPAAYRLADLEAWLEARSFASTAEETVAEAARVQL